MAKVQESNASFFPKAEAAILQSKYTPPKERPKNVAPIFDIEYATKPLEIWSSERSEELYPPKIDQFALASYPDEPLNLVHKYLHPILTRNERLRLTMFWYYTRNVARDEELLSRLEEKIHLVQEAIGWEFVIVGLLDNNSYTRLATYGLPLAILPRRESTCAHTINQPPGQVFNLPSIIEDWRFRDSPHVKIGGLRAYAGASLRLQTEFGEWVAFGSLCVASNSNEEPLTPAQQMTLVNFADWVIADIVQSFRVNRQKEKRHMSELLAAAQENADKDQAGDTVMGILQKFYPDAEISIQTCKDDHISIKGHNIIPFSNFENGLWEDVNYIEDFIQKSNQEKFANDRIIRAIGSKFKGESSSNFLIVASKQFELVFDDVDSWFVQRCGNILSNAWQHQQLREALSAKERFLRGMTHQLRTLIHGILGSTELLTEELISKGFLEGVDLNTPIAEVPPAEATTISSAYLYTIRDSGRELMSTINNMIILNKWDDIAASKRTRALYTPQEIETQLSMEISDIISRESSQASSFFFRNELLDVDKIFIDSKMLKDCILPLLLNSIQNTEGGIITITLSRSANLRDLIIDIEDTGAGIHLNDRKRIFDAYEKGDVLSIRPGLGLTIASKFCQLLNGSLALVSSESGQGSNFRAQFSNITSGTTNYTSERLTDMLKNLPLKFHHRSSNAPEKSLSHNFVKFLTYHGFKPSENIEDGILILDFIADKEARDTSFSSIPPNQIAFCLIPASAKLLDLNNVSRKLICIASPFSTSTLINAFKQADAVSISPMLSNESERTTRLPNLMKLTISQTTINDNEKNQQALSSLVSLNNATLADRSGLANNSEMDFNTSNRLPVNSSAKPVILIVDDNSVNLRILKLYCQRRGLVQFSATDGQKASSIFEQEQSLAFTTSQPPVELILMDLQMPVCDGITATRNIRELEKQNGWKPSIIFIVTGQDSPKDQEDAEKAGANGYLVKPLSFKMLDVCIEQHFAGFNHTA